jgi:hypothetical protein
MMSEAAVLAVSGGSRLAPSSPEPPARRYWFHGIDRGEAMGSSAAESSAEKITHPSQLELPARLDWVNKVFANLDESGRARFIGEFMRALYDARRTDNLRPLQDVVEAWYRTLVARGSTNYEAGIAWAQKQKPRSDEGLDVEELRTRLGK